MKKSLLLTTAALCSLGMMAQTDVTPANWKFYNMEAGTSAYENGIFWEEWASTEWNIRTNTEFVNNVGSDGGIVYASGTSLTGGTATTNWANITEADRAALKNIYESATILDAGIDEEGNPENILCFISSSTDKTFEGGKKATSTMYDGTFFWFTGKDLQQGQCYRLTFEFRAIIGNSVDNGIDMAPRLACYDVISGTGDFKQTVQAGLSNRWQKVTYDLNVGNYTDGTAVFPLIIKWYFHSMLQEGVVLFRSPKLETIDAPEYPNGQYGASTFSDKTLKPGSVNAIEAADNNAIVSAKNGNITVIDANAPVEVYNMAGAKVASVAAPATVETISLDMNGVFVVKVGDKVQKVIL